MNLAEWLHREVRTTHWGYAPEESLDNDALIAERYRGIRPAPGYPACPDLALQQDIWALLKPEQIGVSLTEGDMMDPEASVSALLVHHPEARYFTASDEES